MTTSAADVHAAFCETDWLTNLFNQSVSSMPVGHQITTTRAYALPHDEMLRACMSFANPVAHLYSDTAAKRYAPIADWRAPLPFSIVFTAAFERYGLLSFEQFRQVCINDPQFTAMLWQPCSAMVAAQPDPALALRAMTWRIGLAYLSWMREMVIFTAMRARGVDVRMHPIADIVFKTDMWLGKTSISIFVSNPRYRTSSGQGRKRSAADILAGSSFRTFDIPVTTSERVGIVLAPNERRLDFIAHSLLGH